MPPPKHINNPLPSSASSSSKGNGNTPILSALGIDPSNYTGCQLVFTLQPTSVECEAAVHVTQVLSEGEGPVPVTLSSTLMSSLSGEDSLKLLIHLLTIAVLPSAVLEGNGNN